MTANPMRTPARRRRTSALLAAAVAVLLAGCGAGQVASTAEQTSNAGGAVARLGEIALLDVEFVAAPPVPGDEVYGVGATAPLSMTVANTGREADVLVGVSSPVATGAVVLAGGLRIPGGQTLTAGYEDLAAADLPSEDSAAVALTGLTTPIRSGLTYPVVLTFARAGEVTLQVGVDTPDVPRRPLIDDLTTP